MNAYDVMLTRMRDDSILEDILPGGVYGQALDPDDPETGQAWQVMPGSTSGVARLLPCAVMLQPQEVQAVTAWRMASSIPFEAWPEVYIYAEGDYEAVVPVMAAADTRMAALLHGIRSGTEDVQMDAFRSAIIRADELPGRVWSQSRRYRIRGVRHIVGEG